jgi:transposase
MGNVTTVGIDLAKNLFSMHGVDANGREVLRRTVRREQLTALVAQWPPCLIGLEACSGAHEWARRLSALGHTVRLMAPKLVGASQQHKRHDDGRYTGHLEARLRQHRSDEARR